MQDKPERVRTMAKALAAAAALSALFALAGRSLAPAVPLQAWLLWCFAGTALMVAAVAAFVALAIPLRRYLLQKGSTDPQWFWFKAEPPGLVALREQQREQHRTSRG